MKEPDFFNFKYTTLIFGFMLLLSILPSGINVNWLFILTAILFGSWSWWFSIDKKKYQEDAARIRAECEKEEEKKCKAAEQAERLERQRLAVEDEKQRKIEEQIKKTIESAEAKRLEREHREAKEKWVIYHRYYRLNRLETMSGFEFEDFSKSLFVKLGYSDVVMTSLSGDQGADLTMKNTSGTRIAVQCKRWQGAVGNSAVQEILGGMLYHNCEKGIILTNSTFSRSAKSLAQKSPNIELLDKHWLQDKFNTLFPETTPPFDKEYYDAHIKEWEPYNQHIANSL